MEAPLTERKRILITGASGFCGHYLFESLKRKKSFEIYTTSRRPIQNERHICHDMREAIEPGKFPEKIECIIHCAAVVDEKASGYGIVGENLMGMFNISEFAKSTFVKCVINFSSISVYGNRGRSRPAREDSQLTPVTSYGLSKWISEVACEGILGDKIRWVNLRLGYVLAPMVPDRYFIIRLAEKLKFNQEIQLINPDKRIFNFIDVEDILEVVEILMAGDMKGTYNLVGEGQPTLRDVFRQIQGYYPESRSGVGESDDEESVMDTLISNEKLKAELGKCDFISYKESIGRILRNLNETDEEK